MSEVNGVVEAVRKDGKGLCVDGQWYSSFNPIAGVSRGDTVSFTYAEKGSFKNIKGTVRGGTGGSAAPAAASAAPAGRKFGGFPIDVKDGQRSIIRQNALTNARELVSSVTGAKKVDEAMVAEIIAVARKFEAYSTGDLDIEVAAKYLNDAGMGEA